MDMNKMRAIVFEVVHEILDSDKTRVCMAEVIWVDSFCVLAETAND